MIKFVPAEELKKHYDVRGHFYSIRVPGSTPVDCRSILEITAKHHPSANDNADTDAVFVMMNPGSSKPLVTVEYVVDVECIGAMATAFVPTRPDTTQYQLMRVMFEVGWTYVRVLNLSDLIDTKSVSFARTFPKFEQATGACVHSIFAPERSDTLTIKLRRKPNAPVVRAWGVSSKLDPLIARATNALASVDAIGLAKPGHPGKYFHPLPSRQSRKEEWVEQMLATLRGLPAT